MADGGEGTMETMINASNGHTVHCEVHDPLMNPIEAAYGITRDGKVAIIEMAAASGLELVPPSWSIPLRRCGFGAKNVLRMRL